MNFNFKEPNVKLIGHGNFDNVIDCMKRIEYCARNCYQSTHKITDDSYRKFYNMIIKRGHEAVLEFASFSVYYNPSVLVSVDPKFLKYFVFTPGSLDKTPYMTGSVRAWRDLIRNTEFNVHSILKYIWFMKELFIDLLPVKLVKELDTDYQAINSKSYVFIPNNYKHKLITFEWICDRGVSLELVRHRKMDFAQESSRYCSYNSSGEETNKMFFINPFDYRTLPNVDNLSKDVLKEGQEIFNNTLNIITECYNKLKELGFKNDTARAILPNALKTNVIFACYEDYLPHFFNLRTADTAHYQIRELAKETERLFYKRGG